MHHSDKACLYACGRAAPDLKVSKLTLTSVVTSEAGEVDVSASVDVRLLNSLPYPARLEMGWLQLIYPGKRDLEAHVMATVRGAKHD